VNEYVQKEHTKNSSDISPCCCVSISESLFPNANRYQLDTPKIFFGVENSGFYINTKYFFSVNDSIVRAILYEWEWPKHRLTFSENLSPERSTSNKLIAKYHMLVEGLKEGLSEPTSHTIVEEDFYRESYRWNQDGSPKAYIFILGDKQKNFYRLRLLTYE
jgi:hypothetical protein